MKPQSKNPYVGPRTFTYEDRDRYFGRTAEANTLLSRVISHRLVLFYAQSGAGKSSLINTQLIPSLREAGFAVLPVGRVGGDLPDDVDAVDNVYLFNLMLNLSTSQTNPASLAQVSLVDFLDALVSDDGQTWAFDPMLITEDSAVGRPEMALPSWAGASKADSETSSLETSTDGYGELPYVLIIDQFEEIITTHAGRWLDRADFFQQLNTAMRADPNLWVVLTLRQDYFASLEPYQRYMDNRMRASFYMARMDERAALQAIERPAAAAGRPFAAGVAKTLVHNLQQVQMQGQQETVTGQYVEPVQLQVVCYQLWKTLTTDAPTATEISVADLEDFGNVDQALTTFYETALHKGQQASPQPLSERRLRTWFGSKLITPSGTRSTIFRGDVDTDGIPEAVIAALEDTFLLRSEVRAGGRWVELVHDRLVEPIRTANIQWLRTYHNPVATAYEAWRQSGRDPEKLLYGLALDVAQRFAANNPQDVEEDEIAYLNDSQNQVDLVRKQERQKAKRDRNLLIVGAIAGIFLLLLSIWSIISSVNATASAEEARSAEATAAIAEADALAKGTEVAVQAATAQAGQATAQAAEVNAAEQAEVAHTAEAQAQARAVEAELAQAEAEHQSQIALSQSLAALAPRTNNDNELTTLLALEAYRLNQQHMLWLIDEGLRQVLSQPNFNRTLSGHEDSVFSVAFSPDGQRLASASADGTVRLWDLSDRSVDPIVLSGHEDWVLSVAFSPDGQRLASGSDDRTVRLWRYQTAYLAELGCQMVWRNLSWTEWQRYMPAGREYRQTCPNLPVHPSVPEEER